MWELLASAETRDAHGGLRASSHLNRRRVVPLVLCATTQSPFIESRRDSRGLHWTSANIQRRLLIRIPIALQMEKGKNRCIKNAHSTNHLSANAICLCKRHAKSKTTKSVQYAGCGMQEGRHRGVDTGPNCLAN